MSSGASPPDPNAPPVFIAAVVPLVPVWRVDRPFDYRVRDSAAVAVGSLVRIPFGGRNVRGVVVGMRRAVAERALADLGSLVVEPPLCPPPLERLFEWLAQRYCAPRGVAFARAVPARVRVDGGAAEALAGGPQPRRALRYRGGRDLVADIVSGRARTWSLQTLPGEDRGELICELVAAAGRAQGTALVAVPEVRFGSETLAALARWWPRLARVDAATSEPARSEAWLALAHGHGLGAGGRSAVLAPAPRLRLLVVDEEHAPFYKEDRTPRYDARRAALERARLQGAVCVLVSPTPSLEAAHAGRLGRLRAADPERGAQREARPLVEVLPRPRGHPLSGALGRRVSDAVRAGRRVALLAPARGCARTLWCEACRRSLRCPRCETGVAFDLRPGGAAGPQARRPRVRCPRCGYVAPPPEACPSCGASQWRYLGAGSERLVEQVRKAWPRAAVARADPDVLATERASEPPDIYVTTWIGTKEALRPDVSLVGVLDADALIRRPEWWAAEAAYHALAEMAAWAGPAARGGRLVVHCSDPAHHAVQAVVRADHRFFVERELSQRAELAYPPFSELVRATAAGPGAAELLARVASECRGAGATVLGPVPSPPGGRRAGRARPDRTTDAGRARPDRRTDAGWARAEPDRQGPGLELLAKCTDAAAVAPRLRVILRDAPAGTRLSIDVDPR
jgi:primosomal protein N'